VPKGRLEPLKPLPFSYHIFSLFPLFIQTPDSSTAYIKRINLPEIGTNRALILSLREQRDLLSNKFNAHKSSTCFRIILLFLGRSHNTGLSGERYRKPGGEYEFVSY